MTFDKTKAMRNAEKYLSQGKIRLAIGEYEQVVKFDAKDFGTINMLGDLYSKNTDVPNAIRCYTAVAEHYSKQGFAQKAIAVFNKISKLDPDSVAVWQRLAELYKQKGSIGDSRYHYQRVADRYEKAGKKIEALGIWKEIALLDPTATDAYLSLADAYLQESQLDDALEAYTEVGERFAAKGSHEQAIGSFEKALGISKADPRVLAGYVRSQSALGRADQSAEKLTAILEEFPHSREIRFILIDCLIESGQLAEAEKAVIRLVEMEPANYPKFLELAHLYLENNDVVSSTRILSMSSEHMLVGGQAEQFSILVNAVLEQEPEHLEALRLRARYCSWQRDETALCESLSKLARVAKDAEAVDDERFALLQLTMIVPQESEYADRLREINEKHGFEAGGTEENLFDKRFLKNGKNTGASIQVQVLSADESLPETAAVQIESIDDGVIGDDDTGFAFAGAVEELTEVQAEAIDADGTVVTASELLRLQKEIESIRFYIDNGYLELAEKAAVELQAEFGDRPEISMLVDEVRALTTLTDDGVVEGSAPVELQPGPPAEQTTNGAKPFDLEDLRNELGLEESAQNDSDYETLFNTATAYKEMGLAENAIKEFQNAVSLVRPNDGTRRFFACANLLGHCFMEQGMPHLALTWFERTLETDDLTKDEKQGVWYELAMAYEAEGDLGHAGQFYEQVYAENANFRDVSERVKNLSVNH
jgi:tetratricopeptide (TPR) repeat protein